MRIYIPLYDGASRFIAKTSDVDIRDWRDTEFLEFFERELRDSHTKNNDTVSIEGTEYKNCEIYVPKKPEVHDFFVLVDEDFFPLSLENVARNVENSLPDIDWVSKWQAKSRNSDNYYHNYVVDLSAKYISPRIVWDDDKSSLLTHPNAIRRDSRILLIGQPGAGKTSFVRHLTQVYLTDGHNEKKRANAPLVFFFQLRDFAHKSNDLQNWLKKEEDEVGMNHVINKGSDGKLLFVFDGLDELNESDRGEFSVWLDGFIQRRPTSSTIVTSRELSSLSTGIWQTFKTAKLLPFDRSQVDDFCNLVLEDSNNANDFTGVLDSNPDLQEFLKNPFSLSLALGMYKLRGSLPFNVGVLCKELVMQLIEKWDTRRGISRSSKISAESINSTLGRLAYRLQSNQNAQFSPEDLDDLLPFEIEDLGSELVLQDLSESTGLVSKLDPNIWAFSHRYLQDFFCANHLVERVGGLNEELDAHGRDGAWVDVWRQVGQLCQDPEFFALTSSRNASDSVKSVDRMVSSLLSHDGLSKAEMNKIIEGLTDEISRESSNLPNHKLTNYGVDVNCNELDDQSVLILAKIVTHLSYLRNSSVGVRFLEHLEAKPTNKFGELAKHILHSSSPSVPVVGASSLQVHHKHED